MGTFDDVDLERTERWPTPPARQGGPGRAIVLGVVVLAVTLAGLAWWMRTHRTPGAEMGATAAAVPPTARPAPSSPEARRPTELPPLDELDSTVRRLIGQLSSSPLLSTWVGSENLTRQLAALVDGATSNRLALRFLAPLRPSGTFSVVERSGRTTIAPASFARYDALADVITSLDPASVAGVYRTLAPRLEEAYGELGDDDRSFDTALREGLRQLSATPVPDGPIAVTPQGGLYAFADPKLERLSTAQKLLLRSGPANARRIQLQLAAITSALGPPTDSPASTTP